jgi:hypothetical protein
MCSLQFVALAFNFDGGSCNPLTKKMKPTAPYRTLYSDLMVPP